MITTTVAGSCPAGHEWASLVGFGTGKFHFLLNIQNGQQQPINSTTPIPMTVFKGIKSLNCYFSNNICDRVW